MTTCRSPSSLRRMALEDHFYKQPPVMRGFHILDRWWAIAAHMSLLAGLFAPFPAALLGPLWVMLIKGPFDSGIEAEGVEAFNFGFTVSMVTYLISVAAYFDGQVVSLGQPWSGSFWTMTFMFFSVLWAASRCYKGLPPRYPLCLRVIRRPKPRPEKLDLELGRRPALRRTSVRRSLMPGTPSPRLQAD